jgi:hypothetical protein
VSKDELWAKVVIHNISRIDDNRQPRTKAKLMEAILVNLILKDVRIMHPPDGLSQKKGWKANMPLQSHLHSKIRTTPSLTTFSTPLSSCSEPEYSSKDGRKNPDQYSARSVGN